MHSSEPQPLFMRSDVPATEPALTGLKVGDRVVVREYGYHRSRSEGDATIQAEVIKKARVWVTLREAEGDRKYPREWRFRMDDQTDGSQDSYTARFYAPDQDLFRRAVIEASDYLQAQRIRIDYGSPWRDLGKTVELARIIWSSQNSFLAEQG